MPYSGNGYCCHDCDCRRAKAARVLAYRQKLISKGVVDGTNKMRTLMFRKFN